MKKNGISLIVLVVTIVVTIILSATVILTVDNSSSKARISSFMEELSVIEDSITSYYLQNDILPIQENTEKMTETDIMSLVGTDKGKYLKEEIDLNFDTDFEDAHVVYYYIDLNKLDITNIGRGLGKSNTLDKYVVAYPSLNLYYLDGFVEKSTYYFSLSPKITNKVNIKNSDNKKAGSGVSIQTVQGVTVKKLNNDFSNKLDLSIDSYIEANENIYISIQGQDKILLNTVKGSKNKILIESFDMLVNNNLIDSITLQNYINIFANSDKGNRKIDIIKEKAGLEVCKITVYYPSYDNVSPVIEGDVNIKFNDINNVLSFKTIDNISGINKVTYEYLRKYDDEANIVPVNEGVVEYTPSYMNSNAKRAEISSSGYVEIVVPKDIEGMQICVFDNAGNATTIIKNMSNDIYSTISFLSEKLYELAINLNFNVKTNITSYNAYFSTDNINYTNIFSGDISYSGENVLISNLVFPNEYIANVKDKLYFKVEAIDGSSAENIKKYNRVFECNIDEEFNVHLVVNK